MVKLLLKYGANPYKRLKQTYASVFYSALNGFQNRIEISNYFIDSLKVDVNDVLAIRHRGEGGVDSIRIQDVILFNDYLKAKITSDSITADNILKSNPDERKENIADWNFVKKLQGMGVDFSHKFKKTETSSQNDRK
jgi:hypothetical protein